MTAKRLTLASVGAAVLLVLLAWITAPRVVPPSALADRGERLFPDLVDIAAAASLEVTQVDPRTGVARPFKVEHRAGRWTIPSQYGYPADAVTQVAKVTTGLLALRKDDVASTSPAEFERAGVLDPADPTMAAATGRGTRLTLRDARGGTLADVIIGKPVESRQGYRYVRLASGSRTYISQVGDLRVSTELADWIESDLLSLGNDQIDAVSVRSYSLNRAEGSVTTGQTVLFQLSSEGHWLANGRPADRGAVDQLLNGLIGLRIAGAVPKPAGITATLRGEGASRVSDADRADLARRGFFLAPGGQIVPSRAEVVVRTIRGLLYSLRIGESADTSAAVAGASDDLADQRRYLFITVNFDPTTVRTDSLRDEGQRKSALLQERFAGWYYVVSGDTLSTLQSGLSRGAPR